jgi:hypothetical protein
MILHSEVAVIKMTSLIESEIGTETENGTEIVIENGTEIVTENVNVTVNGTEIVTETVTEIVTVIVTEIETGEGTIGTKTEVQV